jgi:hypothetical protein
MREEARMIGYRVKVRSTLTAPETTRKRVSKEKAKAMTVELIGLLGEPQVKLHANGSRAVLITRVHW